MAQLRARNLKEKEKVKQRQPRKSKRKVAKEEVQRTKEGDTAEEEGGATSTGKERG